jgi:hypothetical protein
MALEGTLKDFSLADIFQLIGLQRKTGVLTLRGKEDTVTVTFLDGKVVAADSLNKRLENRLGNVLTKSGTISVEQLNRALEIQRETLQRLGFILTHYGIISQESLKSALQLQILQIVYRLFRWKDGDYDFSQETTIEYDRDHVVPISAESILMEGARMIDEWPILEKRIRSYDMVFRQKPINQEIVVVSADEADAVDFDETRIRKRVNGDKIRISNEDHAVYQLVNGSLTVADIVEMSRLPEFDTIKALYELLTRDVIEEVRVGASGQGRTEPVESGEQNDEVRVPLPLAAALALVFIGSLATSFMNPVNSIRSFYRPVGVAETTMKAVSLQRIHAVSSAVAAYNLATGSLPQRLEDLMPAYASANLLQDPWGRPYKYIHRNDKFLVIGFGRDGRPDTDLFMSQTIDSTLSPGSARRPTGGISLVD